MRVKIIFLFILISLTCHSQSQLKYFEGTFDQALDLSKENNTDIFLISNNLSFCPSFNKFLNEVENDVETIEFLNSKFIVFGYDLENSSKNDKQRLKKYYRSRGDNHFIYFISKDEKTIAKITYSTINSLDDQLAVWKTYRDFNKEWKSIKKEKRKRKRNNNLDYEFTCKYILYRQIKNSSFDYYQIQNVLTNYIGSIETSQLFNVNNWDLIQKYGTLFSINLKLTDIIATNKEEFNTSIGDSIISAYLLDKYYRNISGRKENKVNRMAKKYPYNTIDEANQAVDLYRTRKRMQSNIGLIKE